MMRTLLLVVLLALWPGVGHAQPEMPPGVTEDITACISERLGPSFVVTRIDQDILVNGRFVFGLSRWVAVNTRRGEQFSGVGGDGIGYWFDDDPLSPPVGLLYVADVTPPGGRDISRDPLYAVGVACFDQVYPRVP